jgi:ribosomal protein S18 acetylase RimI-like enzyme
VLEQASGLSSRALAAIADLERRVVEADGGRLKLEWGRLRGRSGDRVEDLLWWEGDRLLGFLGLYGLGSTLELAGMVSPDARRRGIATALLDVAAPLYRERDYREVLLIVPRVSVGGQQMALDRGWPLDHSEHALWLSGRPTGGISDPGLSLRMAASSDLPVVSRMLDAGFGPQSLEDLARRMDEPDRHVLVIELHDSVVGTLSLYREEDEARIYGFVIDPPKQGRGIGGRALRRVCEQLSADGARRIGLEVAVDNDRALALYTSAGFEPVATEDYFALPLG